MSVEAGADSAWRRRRWFWVPLGLWLGRRHNFRLQPRLGWAVFHLLCGIPGSPGVLERPGMAGARALPQLRKAPVRLTAKNANTVARTLRRPKRTAPKSSHPWKSRGPDLRRGRFCFRRSVSPRGFSFLNCVPIWHGNAASALQHTFALDNEAASMPRPAKSRHDSFVICCFRLPAFSDSSLRGSRTDFVPGNFFRRGDAETQSQFKPRMNADERGYSISSTVRIQFHRPFVMDG